MIGALAPYLSKASKLVSKGLMTQYLDPTQLPIERHHRPFELSIHRYHYCIGRIYFDGNTICWKALVSRIFEVINARVFQLFSAGYPQSLLVLGRSKYAYNFQTSTLLGTRKHIVSSKVLISCPFMMKSTTIPPKETKFSLDTINGYL